VEDRLVYRSAKIARVVHEAPASEASMKLAFIGNLGPTELLLILLIVIVVFGHNRIPQLGEAIGKGIRNFKKSMNTDDEKPALERDPEPTAETKTAGKTADSNKVL
jgi:sec-independent protein translocase protein TatA